MNRRIHYVLVVVLCFAISFSITSFGYAQPLDAEPKPADVITQSTHNDIFTPDLFTGSLKYSFPIEVPEGRKGMKPNLTLNYSSTFGNGWVGVGWELEVGSIERNSRNGVKYDDDNFVLRKDGSVVELVSIGNNEYRTKIEGAFARIRKISGSEGTYWEIADKNGVRYFFGQTAASRQDDPQDATQARIYKWCLNRVEDANGNYMLFYYTKGKNVYENYDAQIYLEKIEYTLSTTSPNLKPSVMVQFVRENRYDAYRMYSTNFSVYTSYRLKAVDVFANGVRVKKYELKYDADPATSGEQYSLGTSRSLLSEINQYGSDGTSLLWQTKFEWQQSMGLEDKRAWITNAYGEFDGAPGRIRQMDVDGDGRSDIVLGPDAGGSWYVLRSTGSSFVNDGAWITGAYGEYGYDDAAKRIRPMDVNGDGKQDIVIGPDSAGNWNVLLSTGSSFVNQGAWISGAYGEYDRAPNRIRPMDVNGDGKQDIVIGPDGGGNWYVLLSTGSSFVNDGAWISGACGEYGNEDAAYRIRSMDLNGDGIEDILVGPDGSGVFYALLSTTSSFEKKMWFNGNSYGGWTNDWSNVPHRIRAMDVNGDRKQDLVLGPDESGKWGVLISTGSTFSLSWGPTGAYGDFSNATDRIFPMDVNGDGRQDIVIGPDGGGKWNVMLSNGTGFVNTSAWISGAYGEWDNARGRIFKADLDGDGRQDIVIGPDASGNWYVLEPKGLRSDLLSKVYGPYGDVTTISYGPAAEYVNPQLPLPLLTVRSIATNDGSKESTTNYAFSGGVYHIAERDFRGFHYAAVTGPAGPTGEQIVTNHWFHQGNKTALPENDVADESDYNAPNGYMKGRPYKTSVVDSQGQVLSETTTTYQEDADQVAPWFCPPVEVHTSTFDSHSDSRERKIVYRYDAYGNMTHQYDHGDLADVADEHKSTIFREFLPNVDKWIVGLPATETSYKGIVNPIQVAKTDFYYDSVADCLTPSTSQVPDKGNVTRIVRWLDQGGDSPETRMAYDSYGNILCRKDPSARSSESPPSSFTYDSSSSTFLTVSKDPLGRSIVTKYYGVDGEPMDKGLYGQIKSVTDPNEVPTVFEYNVFGAKTRETIAGLVWKAWLYPDMTSGSNKYGTVGLQHVRVENSSGLWSEDYFDGLGRVFKNRKSGPDSKTVVSTTAYDVRGGVTYTTLPCFEENTATAKFNNIFLYDPLGRLTRVSYTDGTGSLFCYDKGVTVSIDPNNHRKRETRDLYGRLTKVEEYLGEFTSCTTDVGNPYATTTYEYDTLGNLTLVKDAKNQNQVNYQTEMHYDSIGRKVFMHDPDMGNWYYSYYPDGSLKTKKDAKLEMVSFEYDELGRLHKKDYTTGVDAVFNYDEIWLTDPTVTYPLGRLTSMSDESGTTKYFYDKLGRTTKSVKTVDETSYTIEKSYDDSQNKWTLKYPDEEVVYEYDAGGNLRKAGGYATFSGYNALGQPGRITFGNGVTTDFGYDSDRRNSRLSSITTNSPNISLPIVSLTYDYDNKGNVKTIVDALNSYFPTNTISQTFSPYPGKAHAFGATGSPFAFDPNGNMTSDGHRSILYNEDNMPRSINGVSFIYDGNGSRVKKVVQGSAVTYIDNLLECNGSLCAKYIFAGDKRIALKSTAKTLYYHTDHLGSTVAVTDASGQQKDVVFYSPFGETVEYGVEPVNNKFTSQEIDSESGLYNYNARIYNPELGRFLTADTIVPDPTNPQSLNRYSYVINNPTNLTDPTGHDFWKDVGKFFEKLGQLFCSNGCGAGTGSDGSYVYSGGEPNNYNYKSSVSDNKNGSGDKYQTVYAANGSNYSKSPPIMNYSPDQSISSYSPPNSVSATVEGVRSSTSHRFALDKVKMFDKDGNIALSFSYTSFFQGEALQGGVWQPTISTDFIGASFDFQMGKLPGPKERSVEVSLGVGHHLGFGITFGPSSAAAVLHFGLAFAFPGAITVTNETNMAVRPSFPQDLVFRKNRGR